MADISQISLKASALSNLILVTPNSNKGIQAQVDGGIDLRAIVLGSPWNGSTFLFHYEEEQKVRLESDITDHFVEDNTSLQDQIALKPVTVSTNGFIGELNDIPPPALAALKLVADKLSMLTPFNPQLSITAQLAYNNAAQAYATARVVANTAISAWDSIINGGPSQTLQQVAYTKFFAYWKSRTLFTVQTPWAIHQDMAIKSLDANQDGDTRMITGFSISFKQVQFASTKLSTTFQGRAAIQSMSPIDFNVSSPASDLNLSDALKSSGLGAV